MNRIKEKCALCGISGVTLYEGIGGRKYCADCIDTAMFPSNAARFEEEETLFEDDWREIGLFTPKDGGKAGQT